MKLMEEVKKKIRTWLNIQEYNPTSIDIQQYEDFELAAIKNRFWFRGDANELMQLYEQSQQPADKYKFWACQSSPGRGLRKIHTGLPSMMVRVLVSIVAADMNDFEFASPEQESLWKEIEEENKFRKMLKRSIQEALYIGDGAWKISIDTEVSQYPLIKWVPGDQVEFDYSSGRLKEVTFKKPKTIKNRNYILYEHYGYGSITYELCEANTGKVMDYRALLPELGNGWTFDQSVILAIPFKIFDSTKFKKRGASIYSGKLDEFDALDEVWSLWMHAVRQGRSREYIPENKIPRDPSTGLVLNPNPFDNQYIQSDTDMSEKGENKIEVVQPEIRSDAFCQAYMTALDQCLQGIISPSTLGIDVKKLDNADAQREKEKATLYTRNAIIEALQETLPELITEVLHANSVLHKQPLEEVKVDIPFGEYANPSFESQVETVGKGKTQGIMSVEACVEELYGDSKNDKWKAEEVARLKKEQGIETMEEPALNLEGVSIIEGESGTEAVSDVKGGNKETPENRI